VSDQGEKPGKDLDEGFFQEGDDGEHAAAGAQADNRWSQSVYEGPTRRPGRRIALAIGAVVVGLTVFAAVQSLMKSKAQSVANAPAANAQAEVNCRTAYGKRLLEEVVFTCPRVIEAKPQVADIAVMLADAELERGHTAESIAWAQKAIAIGQNDPKAADAYVFLGGAHKKEGRASEARAAYQKYLELAPTGRHARDVKEILEQP
jgi:tetratricopeptide (TPR) repeat protein